MQMLGGAWTFRRQDDTGIMVNGTSLLHLSTMSTHNL